MWALLIMLVENSETKNLSLEEVELVFKTGAGAQVRRVALMSHNTHSGPELRAKIDETDIDNHREGKSAEMTGSSKQYSS